MLWSRGLHAWRTQHLCGGEALEPGSACLCECRAVLIELEVSTICEPSRVAIYLVQDTVGTEFFRLDVDVALRYA